MCVFSFLYQLMDIYEHLGLYHVLSIVNWAAKNIGAQVILPHTAFISCGIGPSSKQLVHMVDLSFLRHLHIIFHDGCTTLHSFILVQEVFFFNFFIGLCASGWSFLCSEEWVIFIESFSLWNVPLWISGVCWVGLRCYGWLLLVQASRDVTVWEGLAPLDVPREGQGKFELAHVFTVLVLLPHCPFLTLKDRFLTWHS